MYDILHNNVTSTPNGTLLIADMSERSKHLIIPCIENNITVCGYARVCNQLGISACLRPYNMTTKYVLVIEHEFKEIIFPVYT